MRIRFMDGEYKFRPMSVEDIPFVAQMEQVCFTSPWSERMLRAELKNRFAHYIVLETETDLIAYAGMWIMFNEAHITNVAVMPQYRRRGLGRSIMLECMKKALSLGATQMSLEVRVSNQAARNLYSNLGFTSEGRRKRYYEDTGEDALILWNHDVLATIEELRA
ncbi:MAG TPA: ribosomal protein S18-alanine N-acetyltransferase [Clostridia bacterium]|nr:ribosomal protein S18-alanine N-acetyltransferase [Clostridia bacterium]